MQALDINIDLNRNSGVREAMHEAAALLQAKNNACVRHQNLATHTFETFCAHTLSRALQHIC